MCNLRFSSPAHIKDYVQCYIVACNLKTTFKNNRPGKNWFGEFMKRNKLRLKKKKMNFISASYKSRTSNPFLINVFYDLIKQYIEDTGLLPT